MLDKKGNLVKNLCESHYCSGDKKELTDEDHRDWRMQDFLSCSIPLGQSHLPESSAVAYGQPFPEQVAGPFGLMYINVSFDEWMEVIDDAKKWSRYAYGKGWDIEEDDFHTRFVTEKEWHDIEYSGMTWREILAEDQIINTCDDLIYVVWYPDTKEVWKVRHDTPIGEGDTDQLLPFVDSQTPIPDGMVGMTFSDDEQSISLEFGKNTKRPKFNTIPTESTHLYIIREIDNDSTNDKSHFKVGISKNPKNRLTQLKTGSPYHMDLLFSWDSVLSKSLEAKFHENFKRFRVRGEWFYLYNGLILEFIEDIIHLSDLHEGKTHDRVTDCPVYKLLNEKYTAKNMMPSELLKKYKNFSKIT